MQHKIKGGISIAYNQELSRYTLEACIIDSEFCKVKGPRLHIGKARYQLRKLSFEERDDLAIVASRLGIDVYKQLGSLLNPRREFVSYIQIDELPLDSPVKESLVVRISDKDSSNETE